MRKYTNTIKKYLKNTNVDNNYNHIDKDRYTFCPRR